MMAENDKDFGLWISTTTVNGYSIKQFKRGFVIKKRGESIIQRIKYNRDTIREDVTELVNDAINTKKLIIEEKKTRKRNK